MDASAAFEAINEFVKLAAERRVKALPDKKKARLELLDEQIRDAIEGARPAPKRIANPTAAKSKTPAHGVAPAKIKVSASQALQDALDLSLQDKSKLNAVRLEDLPKSTYTPPALPAFMEDYYSSDLVPARVTTQDLPSQAVSVTGETMDLDREVRVLLGLEKPRTVDVAPATVRVGGAPPAPSGERAAPAATPAPAPAPGVQAIVHLMAGGTQRGRLDGFDPSAKQVELLGKSSAQASRQIPLDQVLAVFFGPKKGEPPTPATGTGLVVKLVNDRQVSGMSPDYSEGADSLTLVPEPRRGSIDRIWVPAWAVKAIELT